MNLSETIKLYPTKKQTQQLARTMSIYIDTVNSLVSDAVMGINISGYTTKDVAADLPSALINQCIRDAKSIVRKHYKACRKAVLMNRRLLKKGSAKRVTAPHLPVIKRHCCYINNQNFKISDDYIEFPVMIGGKSKRIAVRIKLTARQKMLLSGAKLGTLRIVYKNNCIVAQVVYHQTENAVRTEGGVMGVDLGILCPAVSYCDTGKVTFYGNGRQNKYMRRHYAYLRRKLQKAKTPEAVKRINNKEQRIMRDIDHKLSRAIVNTAIEQNVHTIKLEQLDNIRSTTRTSRKNNHSLHTWSFYRLAQFIEYKAKLAGISVVYVNPAYTSQKCPVCGGVHKANGRKYYCPCGYNGHRDIVGAINICRSTEIVGHRLSA